MSLGARSTPQTLRSPLAVGALDACLAGLLYVIGWGRAFSFDASRTVAQFVATESIGEVFQQDRFNNPPLFSLLEHLVYLATGSQDERLLRVLPIVFGALTVGIVAVAVARRFGTAAGHVAGATLAVNAMTIRHFREVRGYSLVTLAAVVATVALFRLLRQHADPSSVPMRAVRPHRLSLVIYAAAIAVAIGTHLFALTLIPIHALVVTGSRGRLARWLLPWLAATGMGLLVHWPGVSDGLSAPPRFIFDLAFPLKLAAYLLGGPSLPGMLVLVVVGWTVLRSRPWLSWCLGGTAIMVTAAWLAGPSWLASRFFIWLVPATSVAAGAAVGRSPQLIPVAALCVAVQLAFYGPDLAKSELPNRIAAGFVRASQNDGLNVCAIGRSRAALLAYVDDVRVIWTPPELKTCDIAVETAGPGPVEYPLNRSACQQFAFVLPLPAKAPGAIFAERPLSLAPEFLAEVGQREGWLPTASAPMCTQG